MMELQSTSIPLSPPELRASTTPPPMPGRPPAMARMDTVGDVPGTTGSRDAFDIVAAYHSLLSTDPDLTMPVAAIEALVTLLSATPNLSTISETLDLLNTSVATLKRSIPNSIALSAGTDLFQRYIITTLQRGTTSIGTPIPSSGAAGDFAATRRHLLNNSRLFVSRAKEARRTIATIARRFVRENSTILTNGGSRCVGAVLRAAADSQTREGGAPRFKVIYVTSSGPGYAQSEGQQTIAALRALSVPVATIPESAVAYSMAKVSMLLVGAEGVVENGGIISRMGTYQAAVLARAAGKPVYVVAESHKFVRMFPLGQFDLGFDQGVLNFSTENSSTGKRNAATDMNSGAGADMATPRPPSSDRNEYFATNDVANSQSDGADTTKDVREDVKTVDYTPPELITALITESGVHTPSAVSEELIKIWY